MVDLFEQEMRIKQTEAFIAAESVSLPMTRRPWVSDGSGGWKRGPATPVPSQQVRLVTPNAQLPVRRTADGRDVAPIYTMVGMPDLDVMSGDTFFIETVRYEVIFVQPNRVEATRAEVGYGR